MQDVQKTNTLSMQFSYGLRPNDHSQEVELVQFSNKISRSPSAQASGPMTNPLMFSNWVFVRMLKCTGLHLPHRLHEGFSVGALGNPHIHLAASPFHQSTGFSLGAQNNPHIHLDASPRLRLRTISSTNFIPKGQHVRRLFSHSSFGLFCLAFLEPSKVPVSNCKDIRAKTHLHNSLAFLDAGNLCIPARLLDRQQEHYKRHPTHKLC